ncbi:MAG: alpha-hydroxy-acid oxidizing enzyme [Rhodospirillaceae bacterium]|nr:alpha-hydroxy-acid oxidizing enzyme [Rhodospirillaceae bacterium]
MTARHEREDPEVLNLRSRFQTLHEIVAAARAGLDRNIWDYLRGGAETETTLKRNRASLDAIAFRPRVLKDMRSISTGGKVFGHDVRLPVCLAPIGSLESFDPEGGIAAMRAASRFGCALMLSSVSAIPLEEVAKAGEGLKIAMLYKRGDDSFLDDYVRRAVDAGYDAFCLTVDSAVYSRRERDIANRFVKPWRTGGGASWQAALNWSDIELYKKHHDLPIVLKGIATAEDARIAVEHGVDMIYVSNHGGRQLDHGRGAIEVLPEVVDAVAGQAAVAVDGGFSRGTDIIKALGMGADLVGLGRMLGYSLAAAGAPGVVRMLELLEEETILAMGLLGVTRYTEIEAAHFCRARSVDSPHATSAFPLLGPDNHTY